ncbi:energy transducer TonB [Urechidicola croceus]|uniref:TonB C-terminal domain-containing protein n=1 Tax=Urechidicola croceus TaxID=1850246 RepID=A0A1D8P8J4_9FLAO|nr:energy transducer TonB [Urechidicola croceus]AOW20887.1 hypothetical protein LPB138_09480 [Urechidicola croceus]
MNTKKHTNKLQKSSGLFLQLGLVLTLFTVYTMFEHETEKRTINELIVKSEYQKPDIYQISEEIQIEQEQKQQQETHEELPEPTEVVDIFTTTDDPTVPETQTQISSSDAEVVHANEPLAGLVDVEVDKPFDEDVPFTKIEDVPVFPGCEKGNNEQKKNCFRKKMAKHISKKFNGNLAQQLGLSEGKKVIHVQFIITKNGEIQIDKVRAPHPRLEKEGARVINTLPKMTPGKQRGNPVNVKYIQPITFKIE